MRTLSRFLSVLALMVAICIVALPARAQSLPKLAGHVSILHDQASRLDLDDVLGDAQSLFAPVRGGEINFGYIRHPVWVKLAIPGEAAADGLLTLSPNFLDRVDLYVAAPGRDGQVSDFTLFEAGDHRAPPRDGLSALDTAVPVRFEAGRQTSIYIRIANFNSSTHVSLGLEDRPARSIRLVAQASTFGLWFGGMATLLVTQLVFFYFDRKRQYPLLALSTLGVFLIYFGNLGYSHLYLFPQNGAANNLFIGFNAWAGLAASALAYDSILDLKRRQPWAHGIYLLIAAVGVIGVGFALAGRNIVFGPFGATFSIIAATLNMIFGLYYANRDGAASRMTAAAFVAIFVGASLSMVQRLGLEWMPNWISHSYGIAGLLQAILLTGSLAIRLRDAEQANVRMKDAALNNAIEAERLAANLVEERTGELVQARRMAEDALHAEMQSQLRQVRFLEVVSHQYRTPLAAIRSSVDSLALDAAMRDGANRERLERIRRGIGRLVEILDVNLKRSQMEGASFRATLSRMAIGPVIESAVSRARDLFNGHDIDVDVPPGLAVVRIEADAGMLELAIINLVENGVKYSAIRRAPKVALSLAREGDRLVLSVADNGIGIPENELSHVFENSMRGSNVAGIEGSGMGLFLVQRIAAAHGGTAHASSRPCEGAVIRITLPVAAG